MAKVLPKQQQPDAQEDNDLEILHPEQEVIIAGVRVVIREYGFVEGLKIRTKAKPFIHGLQEILSGGQPSLEEILDLLAEHLDLALELVADSVDMPLDWVHSVSMRGMCCSTPGGACAALFLFGLLKDGWSAENCKTGSKRQASPLARNLCHPHRSRPPS